MGEMGTLDVMRGDNGGFMVGNDENEFTEAVLSLLDDEALRARQIRGGRSLGGAIPRRGTTIVRLERLYKVVAHRHSRRLRLRSGIR